MPSSVPVFDRPSPALAETLSLVVQPVAEHTLLHRPLLWALVDEGLSTLHRRTPGWQAV